MACIVSHEDDNVFFKMKPHAILTGITFVCAIAFTQLRSNPVIVQANLLPILKKTAMNERSFLEFSDVGVLISSGKRSVTFVIKMRGIRNLKPWQRFL